MPQGPLKKKATPSDSSKKLTKVADSLAIERQKKIGGAIASIYAGNKAESDSIMKEADKLGKKSLAYRDSAKTIKKKK